MAQNSIGFYIDSFDTQVKWNEIKKKKTVQNRRAFFSYRGVSCGYL